MAGILLTRVDGTEGVTVTFRQSGSDLNGAPIELHVQAASALPPAPAAQPVRIALGNGEARWTPEGAELEWLSHGIYRSLTAPGRDLDAVAAIASSIPSP